MNTPIRVAYLQNEVKVLGENLQIRHFGSGTASRRKGGFWIVLCICCTRSSGLGGDTLTLMDGCFHVSQW